MTKIKPKGKPLYLNGSPLFQGLADLCLVTSNCLVSRGAAALSMQKNGDGALVGINPFPIKICFQSLRATIFNFIP
jgi:hypothetical protein